MKKSKIIISAVIIVLVLVFAGISIYALSMDDANQLLRSLVGLDVQPDGADVNEDGNVNILDYLQLVVDNTAPEAKISSLTVGEYSLSPAFSSSTYSYTVNLPAGRPRIPEVEITAPASVTTTVKQATIADDETTGIATVTAKCGLLTQTYTINFVRDEANGFRLQYDDRYTFTPEAAGTYTFESSNASVASVDETGKITALAVSNSPVEIYAKQDSVIVETFTIDKIEKAAINIFFVTGQSNANGCYDLANDQGEQQLTAAEQLALAPRSEEKGQVYSYNATCNKYAKVDALSPYPYDTMYDINDHSCNGFGPALGIEWYELSGEKTVLCQTALNATAIEVWIKGGAGWGASKINLYQKTIEAYNDLVSELGSNYEINRVANFWLQGETCMTINFNPDFYGTGAGGWDRTDTSEKMQAEEYYSKFMQIDADMRADFGLEYNCILLARSGSGATLNEIRAAQYSLNNNNEGILLSSRVCDFVRMVTDSDTTSYGYGFLGLDNVHCNQIGFNAHGETSAQNLFYYVSVESDKSSEVTSVEIVGSDGKTRLTSEDTLTINKGIEYRIEGMTLPEWSNGNLTYTSSNTSVATVDIYGAIAAVDGGECVITVTAENGVSQSVNVRVPTLVEENYRWEFDGNLNEVNGKNNLKLSAASEAAGAGANYSFSSGCIVSTNGTASLRPNFTMAKPVTLDSSNDWTIEYKASFKGGSIILGNESTYTHNCIYNAYTTREYYNSTQSKFVNTGWYYPLVMFKNGSGDFRVNMATPGERTATSLEYDFKVNSNDKTFQSLNTSLNTWKIDYDAATKTCSYYWLNTSTSDWELVNSVTTGTYSMTLTDVFGRYTSAGMCQFYGTMDYLDITFMTEPETVTYTTYTWEFNGNLEETNGANNLTLNAASETAGATVTYDSNNEMLVSISGTNNLRPVFDFEKPITLSSGYDWSIEYKAQFNSGSILLGQECSQYGLIYNAFTTSGFNYPMRFVSSNNTVKQILYGDNKDLPETMNAWKLEYTASDNTCRLSIFDEQSQTYTPVIGSVVMGEFAETYTNLFGRFNDAGLVNFKGTMDWFRVTVCDNAQVD